MAAVLPYYKQEGRFMSKVSVIIPVYRTNISDLERCINSLIKQTLKEIEIILVDDGSPDRCGLICNMYAEKDARIFVIHQKNAGVSAARNAGISVANGDFIGFVDADDYVEFDFFERLYNAAQQTKLKMICSGYCIEKENESFPVFYNSQEILSQAEAMKEFFICRKIDFRVWNKLFHRSIVEKISFSSQFAVGEDELFIYQALKLTEQVAYEPCCAYHYVIHNDSVMQAQFSRKNFHALEVANLILMEEQRDSHVDIQVQQYFYTNIALRIWLKIHCNLESMIQYRDESEKIYKSLRRITFRSISKNRNKTIFLFFVLVKYVPRCTAFCLRHIRKLQSFVQL